MTRTPSAPSKAPLTTTGVARIRGVPPGGRTAPLPDPARHAARHARRWIEQYGGPGGTPACPEGLFADDERERLADVRREREEAQGALRLAQARPHQPPFGVIAAGDDVLLRVEGHFVEEGEPRYPVAQVEPLVPAQADLDPQSFEELAERSPEAAAIAADIWVKHQQGTAREAWIRTAKVVYIIFEKKLWRQHPGQFTSFGQWAKQSEIDLSGPVASDMHAITQFAPLVTSECGLDLWDVIRECGPAKVRQLVPHMRDAYQEGTFGERITELLELLPHTSFRGVLAAIGTQNVRGEARIDRAVYADNGDGTSTITLQGVDFDALEAVCSKLRISAWYNQRGDQLLNPMDPNFDAEP